MDSPPFDPPSPLINRQKLSPSAESSLRRSCAVILQEFNDPGYVYEDIATSGHRRLDREAERAKATNNHGGDASTQKTWNRYKRNPSEPGSAPAPYTHIPTNAAASFEHTVTSKKPSQIYLREHVAFEPLEPTHTTVSPAPSNSLDPQHRLRANLNRRPITSNATCLDRSEDTSSSTTRTNTTYDRGRSTGLTSAALTPRDSNNEERFSQRISEQILQDGPSASMADATAKAWMAQELAKRRAETASAPPPSRARAEPERPQSRAGSIKEGIKQYIRPRASQDSLRSVARSESTARDSNNGKNGGTWWRGGSMRRQGSSKSLRDGQDNDPGRPLSFIRGTDLNRALPALPGLDNWQEKKKPPMHIAHLMRGSSNANPKSPTQGSSIGSKKTKEKPTIVDEDGIERTLSKSEDRLRQKDLKKAVEEKMRKGAMVNPTVSADLLDARQKSLEREKKKTSSKERGQTTRQSVALPKSAKVPVKAAVTTDLASHREKPTSNAEAVPQKTVKERPGLRKRFSRMLLGSSSGNNNHKATKAGRKGFDNITEYEGP